MTKDEITKFLKEVKHNLERYRYGAVERAIEKKLEELEKEKNA